MLRGRLEQEKDRARRGGANRIEAKARKWGGSAEETGNPILCLKGEEREWEEAKVTRKTVRVCIWPRKH